MRLAALMIALSAGAAFAQAGTCLPHEKAKELLETRYGETLQAIGLTAQGMVMEIFAAPNGSWTVLFVTADGVACFGPTGYSLESVIGKPGVQG